MELCYSYTGRPYIVLEDSSIFIFSEETSTPTHFKYLIFSGMVTSTLTTTVSGGKGKPKKTKVVAEEAMKFFIPFTFKGMPRGAKKVIDEDDLDALIDIITPMLENELFPKTRLTDLEAALKGLECDEDPVA